MLIFSVKLLAFVHLLALLLVYYNIRFGWLKRLTLLINIGEEIFEGHESVMGMMSKIPRAFFAELTLGVHSLGGRDVHHFIRSLGRITRLLK